MPDLLLEICRCLSRILRPRLRHLNLDDRDLLAPQAVEAPLDSILGLRLRSVPLPLSDSSLGKRVMLASTRSLPEPPQKRGGFRK